MSNENDFDPAPSTPWRFLRRMVRTAPADPFADPDWLVTQGPPRAAVIRVPKGPLANQGSAEFGIHFQVLPFSAAGLLVNLRTILMELQFETLIRMPQLNPNQAGVGSPIITNGNATLTIIPGTQELIRVDTNLATAIAPSGLQIIPRLSATVIEDLTVTSLDIYVAVA